MSKILLGITLSYNNSSQAKLDKKEQMSEEMFVLEGERVVILLHNYQPKWPVFPEQSSGPFTRAHDTLDN